MQKKPPLAFDDAFITGVDEIDDQHRNLIDLTNEADRVFAAGAPANRVRSGSSRCPAARTATRCSPRWSS